MFFSIKNAAGDGSISLICNYCRIRRTKLLAFLLGAFALLVSDAAAGLASGLAGSLAFAAAAVLGALAQIAGLDGLDVLHDATSRKMFL